MYLKYQPEGSEAPQILDYSPKKMMSPECEAIEKKTGMTFEEFNSKVVEGHVGCRRALLWTLQKRQHPTMKYEDVQFAYGELELCYYKHELEAIKAAGMDALDEGDERDNFLKSVDELIEEAQESPDSGKAPSNN